MPPRKIKVEEPIIEEPIIEEPPKKVKKVRVKKVKPIEVVSETKIDDSVRPSTPKPKKTSKWINALKEYNKDRGSYLIPKKGTEEYDNVRKMMESMSI